MFIVVRVHNPCSDSTTYSVAVTRSKSVPMFGPAIPKGAVFAKSKAFADWLLTKIMNAEIAAHKSEKFVSMATRTRHGYLMDLSTNHVTQTTIDSGSKFREFEKLLIGVRNFFFFLTPSSSYCRPICQQKKRQAEAPV